MALLSYNYNEGYLSQLTQSQTKCAIVGSQYRIISHHEGGVICCSKQLLLSLWMCRLYLEWSSEISEQSAGRARTQSACREKGIKAA